MKQKLARYLSQLALTLSAVILTAIFVAPATGQAASSASGELRVAATDVPAALANPYKSVGATTGSIWDLLFDCLVQLGADGSERPGLAVRWETVNETTWRFHLRPDVQFQDGTPVTATSVVGAIEILKAHPEYPVAEEVRTIARATAIGPLTVEIVTKQADAVLPRRFALIRIVDPIAWNKLGPDEFARKPNGSGSYFVTSWGSGNSQITLEANAKSWRAPKSVKRVVITILKDATARVQALMSGQVDVALSLNPDDIETLKAGGMSVYVSRVGQVQVWALPNILKPDSPLRDVRVRQAMNYAVNKDEISKVLIRGIGAPATQGGTMGTFGYDKELEPYPYDPGRARKLLQEAGYPNGFPLIADVVVGLGPADDQIHQKVAADLRAIGLKVELRTTPYSARPAKFYGGQWGDVDVFSSTWNSGLYRDVSRSAQDFSCERPNPYFCDKEISELLSQSKSVMDPAKREAMLKNIMRLNHERASSLWLTEYNSIIGLSARVGEFTTRPTGMVIENIVLK